MSKNYDKKYVEWFKNKKMESINNEHSISIK